MANQELKDVLGQVGLKVSGFLRMFKPLVLGVLLTYEDQIIDLLEKTVAEQGEVGLTITLNLLASKINAIPANSLFQKYIAKPILKTFVLDNIANIKKVLIAFGVSTPKAIVETLINIVQEL
jgi:hypothetical protein